MTSNIAVLNAHGGKAQFYNYRYDQLNRLVGMDAYTGLEEATNSWTSLTAGDAYRERVRYDGNGNILRYVRHDQYGQLMDSLLYHYYDQRNQLRQVEDPAGSQVALGDVGNQSATNNYVYDPVGNMTGDLSEQMDPAGGHGVSWNVYGKITRITRSAATALSQSSELQYGYDAAGNRIHNSVSRFNSTITDYSSYVRDAQGNILAIYTASGEGSDLSALDLKLSERELYGSSRLGSDVSELRVDSLDAATPAQGTLSYYRGLRRYELVNHLGNVLAVISDRKIALPLEGSSLIAHYEPDVLTATDYYPFGMRMPGRQYGNGPVFAGGDYDSTSLVNGYSLPADLQLSARPDRHPEEYVAATSIELLPGFSSSEGDSYQLYIAEETYAGSGNQPPPGSADGKAGYRFGFNRKENDNEVKGEGNQQDYGMRISDPRLGKFLSVDPLTKKYPELTPCQFASNRPVDGIDEDGLEYHPSTINTERQNASESVSNVSMPYPPEEMIRQSIEKANQKNRAFLQQGHTEATVGPSKSPKNAYEKKKLNSIRNSKYAEIGYGSDGSPGFLNNLAQNKTWNSAANNLVIPALEFASLVDGVGEIGAIYKGLRSLSGLELEVAAKGEVNIYTIIQAEKRQKQYPNKG